VSASNSAVSAVLVQEKEEDGKLKQIPVYFASKALLTVYFGTPSMFITLWFGFDYGTNLPLGTLIM
jgi:hypothetical protein